MKGYHHIISRFTKQEATADANAIRKYLKRYGKKWNFPTSVRVVKEGGHFITYQKKGYSIYTKATMAQVTKVIEAHQSASGLRGFRSR